MLQGSIGFHLSRTNVFSLCAYVGENALQGIQFEPQYLLGTDDCIVVSASVLAQLATPSSTSQKLNRRALDETYQYQVECAARYKKMHELVVMGLLNEGLEDDLDWLHLRDFLLDLCGTHDLIAWELSMVGCIAGCVYGTTIRSIFQLKDDPTTEELLDFRFGAKPSGTRPLEAWLSSNCAGVLPDSVFSAHVLQLNLSGQAREQELARHGVLVNPSRMRIVYASPARDEVDIVDVSQR